MHNTTKQIRAIKIIKKEKVQSINEELLATEIEILKQLVSL